MQLVLRVGAGLPRLDWPMRPVPLWPRLGLWLGTHAADRGAPLLAAEMF